jgi:hypothetical protein
MQQKSREEPRKAILILGYQSQLLEQMTVLHQPLLLGRRDKMFRVAKGAITNKPSHVKHTEGKLGKNNQRVS